MKPSELKKDAQLSLRINKETRLWLKAMGLSPQQLFDTALNEAFEREGLVQAWVRGPRRPKRAKKASK